MIDLNTATYGYIYSTGERPVNVMMHASQSANENTGNILVAPFKINQVYLESTIHTVRSGMLRGAELSVNLAKQAINYVDAAAPVASAVGAANVVKLTDENSLVGLNTHVDAFTELVMPQVVLAKIDTPMAIIFGTGYAARVAIYSLLPICKMFCIVSRNPTSHNTGLSALERMLGSSSYHPVVETATYDNAVTDPYDIIVNATTMGDGTNKCSPIGLSPSLTNGRPRDGQIYVEMPVGDHKSYFLPDEYDNATTINGMSITAYSSAAALTHLTGLHTSKRGMLCGRYLDFADSMYSKLSPKQLN